MKGIIIYATKHGCTEKAAKLLKSKLSGDFDMVDLKKDGAPDLSGYDTVILGSPIYIGQMLREMSDFMKKNIDMLLKKRLGVFLCAGEKDPQRLKELLVSVLPSQLYYHAAVKEIFGGELDLKNVGAFMRFMLRVCMGIKEGYSTLSEEKISSFGRAVAGAAD